MTIARQALYITIGRNELKSKDVQAGKCLFETLASSCEWQTFSLSLAQTCMHIYTLTYKHTLTLRLPDTDRKTCSCSEIFFLCLFLWERSQRQAKGVIVFQGKTSGAFPCCSIIWVNTLVCIVWHVRANSSLIETKHSSKAPQVLWSTITLLLFGHLFYSKSKLLSRLDQVLLEIPLLALCLFLTLKMS